jgi:hypothetical protein
MVITAFVSYITLGAIKRAREARNGSKKAPPGILRDSDGNGSLTNFQFLIWTAVFLFSIVWVYTVRIQGGVLAPAIGIPLNALALMGVNTASAVTSKAITAHKQRKSMMAKARAKKKGKDRNPSLWTMLDEDEGRPTLARVQMFIWTLVSVAIYVGILFAMLVGPFVPNSNAFVAVPFCALSIPDVDPTLVTLMGLSHVAYLGRKYYSTTSA